MKAALWYKAGDIRIEDIPEPSPCAGEEIASKDTRDTGL